MQPKGQDLVKLNCKEFQEELVGSRGGQYRDVSHLDGQTGGRYR